MQLDGGVACLDFINSGYDTEKEVIVERLHTYTDLLLLAERLSLVSHSMSKELAKRSENNKIKAKQVLITARKAREVMFEIFSQIAAGEPENINKKNLEAFNAFLLSARNSEQFEIVNGKLELLQSTTSANLMQPLWAFFNSAFHLLRDGDQHLIKQCSACAWLFLDQTKNHRRKWCDMQTCGSIEKSKRYYRRSKGIE